MNDSQEIDGDGTVVSVYSNSLDMGRLSDGSDSSLSTSTSLTISEQSSSQEQDESAQNIRVVARIRPLSSKEQNENSKEVVRAKEEGNKGYIAVEDHRKPFEYDAVFGPSSTQSSVYEKTAGDLIRNNLFKGFNVTVLAYGQTGSGKTHTILGRSTGGCSSDILEIDGIIPRAVHDVFRHIDDNCKDRRIKVEMSYLEIYNEEARDLLSFDTKSSDLVIRESKSEGVVVRNLSRHPVASQKEVGNLMDSASSKRATASTAMNLVSSRSHAICTLYITVSPIEVPEENERDSEDTICAKLTLVDLAGSERIKKTKAEGTRMIEGININKGLFVLGQVVSALSEMEQNGGRDNNSIHVKYRDSKLTRLLQDSLGGNSKTVMVACVSPADSNVEETVNTLRYAERTRNIKNTAMKNVLPTTISSAEAAALRRENHMLKLQLFQAETKLKSMSTFQTSSSLHQSHQPINSAGKQSTSLQSVELVDNEINDLDIKDLSTITKLRLHCSALEEKVSQAQKKSEMAVDDSLEAAQRADKWQLKCEQLMAIMKSKGIEYPDNDLGTEGRFQALSMVNDLRKELIQLKENVRDAESNAEISRSIAAAVLNGNGDLDIAEKMVLASEHDTSASQPISCDGTEEMKSTLVAMSGTIDKKEEMMVQMVKERQIQVMMKSHFEASMKALQVEVESLTIEKDQLMTRVRRGSTSTRSTDQVNRMRQRVSNLEDRIKQLKQKSNDHARSLRLKTETERKCKQLEAEIREDKKKRTALQRKLKEETAERQLERKAAKMNASRMLRESQRLKYELNKVKEAATRQEAILRRKASEALHKQRTLADHNRKRSHASTVKTTLSGDRKDKLNSWIDRELNAALTLRELKVQIDEQSQSLDDAEAKKEILVNQQTSQDISPTLKTLDAEINLRSSVIKQLEKNVNEVMKAANRNPTGNSKLSGCFLELTFWQGLSRAESRFACNTFFERLVDQVSECTHLKNNFEDKLSVAVDSAVDEQKREAEKELMMIKIHHSTVIADLLESTKLTVQQEVKSKLLSEEPMKNDIMEKAMDDIVGNYLKSCVDIAESVKQDLQSIKSTQEGMQKAVSDVAVEIMTKNEVRSVLQKKKKKKQNLTAKSRTNLNGVALLLSDEEGDVDQSIILGEDDTDDSDWSPDDTPSKRRVRQRNDQTNVEPEPITQTDSATELANVNLEKLKVQDLRQMLRERGLTVSGKKAELIQRLKYNAKAGAMKQKISTDDTLASTTSTTSTPSTRKKRAMSKDQVVRSVSKKKRTRSRQNSPSSSSGSYQLSKPLTPSRKSGRLSLSSSQTSDRLSTSRESLRSSISTTDTKSTISSLGSPDSRRSQKKTRGIGTAKGNEFIKSPTDQSVALKAEDQSSGGDTIHRNKSKRRTRNTEINSKKLMDSPTNSSFKPSIKVSQAGSSSTSQERTRRTRSKTSSIDDGNNTAKKSLLVSIKTTRSKVSNGGDSKENNNSSAPSLPRRSARTRSKGLSVHDNQSKDISVVTESAKKRRTERRRSMAKSVNKALFELEQKL